MPTKKRKYTQYHLRLKKAAGLSHWLRMYWDINQIRECDYKKDHTKINQIWRGSDKFYLNWLEKLKKLVINNPNTIES